MKNEASPDSPVRLAAITGDGPSDNGLADDDDTTQKRFRRPGPWSVVPNFVLTSRRLRGLSDTARALNVFGWIYANANRTDGEIGADDLAGLAAAMNIASGELNAAAGELITAGLWQPGFRIVDYLKWCHSRATIELLDKEGQDRARKWREDHKKVFSDSFQKQTATDSNREQQKATGTYGVRTRYVLGRDGTPKGEGEPD